MTDVLLLLLATDSAPVRVAKGLAIVVAGLAILAGNARSRRLAEIRNAVPRLYLGETLGRALARLHRVALWLAGAAAILFGLAIVLDLVRY